MKVLFAQHHVQSLKHIRQGVAWTIIYSVIPIAGPSLLVTGRLLFLICNVYYTSAKDTAEILRGQ